MDTPTDVLATAEADDDIAGAVVTDKLVVFASATEVFSLELPLPSPILDVAAAVHADDASDEVDVMDMIAAVLDDADGNDDSDGVAVTATHADGIADADADDDVTVPDMLADALPDTAAHADRDDVIVTDTLPI